MSRNRWAQCIFVAGIAMAVLRLVFAYGVMHLALSVVIMDAVLLSATAGIVCGLLLHLRFVLYVSNDPPIRSASRQPRPEKSSTKFSEQSTAAAKKTGKAAAKSAKAAKKKARPAKKAA